jgi:glycosyltransferase involved in cell wall biosynthesis
LNPGARLRRCIQSIGEQTYRRIEHLAIDGGSTDGTVALLESSGIRWISEPDDGQAAAINKGWRMAQGQILGWLNADDELLPDAVERAVGAFSSSRDVGWVLGWVEIREGRGGGFVRRPSDPARPLSWAAQNLAAQPGSFASRAALERVGYLDERLNYMMDFDLWVRLLDEGLPVKIVPRVLAHFEVHPDSKSGSLSHSEFVVEEALVRLRSGRSRSGALAVGRAAAIRAWEAGRHDPQSMREEQSAIADDPRLQGWPLDRDVVDAGFRAESLLMAIKERRFALAKDAAGAYIWRCPEARARLLGSMSRGWARVRFRILHR